MLELNAIRKDLEKATHYPTSLAPLVLSHAEALLAEVEQLRLQLKHTALVDFRTPLKTESLEFSHQTLKGIQKLAESQLAYERLADLFLEVYSQSDSSQDDARIAELEVEVERLRFQLAQAEEKVEAYRLLIEAA